MAQKIGLLGCSNIAQKSFFPYVNSSKLSEMSYIGSRSISKAKVWAKKYDCNYAGSYDDVINSDVDAVYISLPIGLHEEWAIKALKSGKHVLCEKSSTTSYDSAIKMVAAAKENKKRILEGFSFRFHPQHQQIRSLISKNVGKLKNFYGIYGFPPPNENDIRWQLKLGGGVLNDVACYPICASRLVFQAEPISVLAHLDFDEASSVDKSLSVIAKFANKETAFISAGFDNYYQSKYSIWGSEAKISTKRAYAVPRDYATSIYLHKDDKISEKVVHPADQFSVMFDTFSNVISGRIENPYDFEKDLLNQARLMESIRVSQKESRIVYLSEMI